MLRTLCALLLLLTASLPAQDTPDPSFLTALDGTLPEFSAQAIDGATISSADSAPVTILHIYSCDSELCGASLKSLQEFVWQPLQDEGIRVLGIARDADAKQARQHAREYGLTFPLLPDSDRELAGLFSEGGKGVPRTLITDAEGKIVYQHAGYRPSADGPQREAEWRLVAEALLRGEPVPRFVAGSGAVSGGGGLPDGMPGAPDQDFIGKEAPKLEVEAWVNQPPADMTGKYQLYEFWATWCPPCRMSMPGLEKLSKEHADNLVILSISDEPMEDITPYVKEEGFTYPIGTDTQGRTKNALGVSGIPAAFLVNPEGKIVWQGHPMSLEMEEGLLEGLLNGESPQVEANEATDLELVPLP